MSLDRVRDLLPWHIYRLFEQAADGIDRFAGDGSMEYAALVQLAEEWITHEKEDVERVEALQDSIRAFLRALEVEGSDVEGWHEAARLVLAEETLRTQLQDLLEAAKAFIEVPKVPTAGNQSEFAETYEALRQVIQNIEGIKVDRTG